MAAFYRDFELLMQRMGPGTHGGVTGYGKTTVVHVEPDLSAYAERAVLSTSNACYGYCSARGNNPAYLRAAVASSGVAEVTSIPNTYQGFNWALLHLRDLFAPNVVLALHVSGWGTGPDIDSDHSQTLNANALGEEAGQFAALSGIVGNPPGLSEWDLIFNDLANQDAGRSSDWWDRLNGTFPNFSRWEDYVSAVSVQTGRWIVAWQVPEGNQFFETEDNLPGHYQDNRAEYFFGHIAELVAHGVAGMIFGSAAGHGTEYWDAQGDGITNPPSFCTSSGLSSGSICNTHASTVADDDGGYIRAMAQQYYARGRYRL
jgi:hypothetical protein